MGKVSKYNLSITTGAAGGGTATTTQPLCGYIDEIRTAGTALGGTATFVFTRVEDGGTVLNYTHAATGVPWSRAPRHPVHSTFSGGALVAATGGSALADRMPIDGYLQAVISGGSTAVTESVYIFVC